MLVLRPLSVFGMLGRLHAPASPLIASGDSIQYVVDPACHCVGDSRFPALPSRFPAQQRVHMRPPPAPPRSLALVHVSAEECMVHPSPDTVKAAQLLLPAQSEAHWLASLDPVLP